MARKKRPATRPASESGPPPPGSDAGLHRVALLVLFLVPFVFYWKLAFGNQMLFGTDFLGAGGYWLREFMARYIARHGGIALWLPHLLGGQLTVAGFYGDAFYPTTLFRLFLPVHVVWNWTFILHTFVAGLGTYLFLKELKLSVIPAALGGLAYMLCGSLMTLAYAGHDGRLMGTALLPLALFFLHRAVDRRRFVLFLLCGLVVGLQLLSGHVQKVYYTVLILVAYFAVAWVRTIRQERSAGLAVRLAVFFGIGMLFALALSAVQYLPIIGNMPFASRGAERGYAYASSWSMPLVETFDLLTPRFSGGLDRYWSSNAFKLHSEYLGILPLFFAFVAVLRRWRDPSVRFFTAGYVLTQLMAWGGNTPFYYLPYYLLPGVSKFRGPGMIYFVAAFSLAVLAGLGVHAVFESLREKKPPRLGRGIIAGAVVPLVLLLLFAVARQPVLSLLRPATGGSPEKLAALDANYPGMLGGLLAASTLALAGFGLVALTLRRRLNVRAFAGIAATVMVLDVGLSLNLWNEARGYIRAVPPPAQYFAPDEAVAFLRTDTSLYRVLPLNYERSDAGVLMGYGIQSAGGQLPNPLQTYQDFIGAGQSVMFQPGNLLQPNFMDVLNIKYIIGYTLPDDVSRYDPPTQAEIARLRALFSQPRFRPVSIGSRYTVYRNDSVLPRAWLAPRYELVDGKDALLARLADPAFDPSTTVLLADDPGLVPGPDSIPGEVQVARYDANAVTLRARTAAPALLVLSENWHPDWQAYVDGRRTPVLRAFHTLRAVPLEPGDHEVRFRHESGSLRLGSFVSLASLVFLAGFGIAALIRRRRPHRPDAPQP